MSHAQSGDANAPERNAPSSLPPEKPVRPSWEAAPTISRPAAPMRQNPAPRPAALSPQSPVRPMPPVYTPPAAPAAYVAPSYETPVEYDLAGNPLPQTAQAPSPHAAPSPYAPPAPYGYSAGNAAPGVWPPPPSSQRPGAAAYSAHPDRIAPKKLLLGILLGLVIGIIGGIIIEKILFYAHFGLSLLYVGMGYGIGWGIHRVTGRGGPGLAMLAVGLMVACLGVSHLVWAQDVLNEARNLGNVDPRMTAFDAFPIALGNLGIMHWVCITFGLLACYRGVEQQSS